MRMTCDLPVVKALGVNAARVKEGAYVCQREGVVYRDNLAAKSIALIRQFVRGKRADAEDGCPDDILVQSRTKFVNGEFWNALRAGAVIVNFNAPFDLSRLALAFPEAKSKNAGWSMEFWKYQGKREKLKPRITIKPKDSGAAFINLAGGDPTNRLIYKGRFLDRSVLGFALRNKHLDLNGFLRSFGLKEKMPHEPTGRVTTRELAAASAITVVGLIFGSSLQDCRPRLFPPSGLMPSAKMSVLESRQTSDAPAELQRFE